jgi:hypothetical protein
MPEAASSHKILTAGAYVDQCRFDYGVVLAFRLVDGTSSWVRIGCPFRVAWPDGTESLVVPAEQEELGSVLRLLRATSTGGTAFEDGRLEVRFQDGSILVVSPDERYEAWTAAGPAGALLVSLPGGGLAVWGEGTG